MLNPTSAMARDNEVQREAAEQEGKKEGAHALFCIGQRVMMSSTHTKDKDPQLGTIKYVGSVQGQQGLWVGVDWDSGEGRHDGSLNGTRYFQARLPASASFVRPHLLSTGITLLHAVTSRYKGDESETVDDDGMYLLSVRQKRVAVQLVGKEKIENKQKHLEDLTSASLVYKAVVSAGDLQGVLPSLEELDLTGNLLPDWQAVNLICDQLPALRVLDLSRNRMQYKGGFLPALGHLQTLVLNFCQMSWGQIEGLKHSLPVLEELHLCGNEISVLEVENGNEYVEGFKCLRLLNLEHNCIEAWEEVLKLSKLESLEQLQVSHNKLKHIVYPDTIDCADKPFRSLRCLLFAGNAVEDWGSLDALDRFPNLKEVRVSDNPLTDLDAGGAPRFLLVSRLANISVLNGSEIKQRERKDSEIRYVHYVMNTMPTSDEEERVRAHPRFLELKKLYDLDEEQSQTRKGAGSAKMADSLRSVTLLCVALSVGEKAPSIKKLPLSTTIGKLKLVCEAVFKVKASKQRLYLREQDVPVPVPLNDDLETLRDVGIGFDTTILVDEAS